MSDIGIKISATDAASGVFKTVASEAGRLQGSISAVSGVLASLGVGLSAGAFLTFVTNINNGVDALNDLKDATGASIENISALEDVARRTGSSFDTVSTALIKLNQGLSAAKPGSDTERAIKAIGLSVAELKTLDPAEAFRRIAVSLSGFEDDANKARLTQELFGKSLKEVAPLLKDLADQGQLNATVTTAQAEAAEKLNKQIFNLQKNAIDAGRAITGALVPALSDGVDRFLLAQKHAGGLLDTLALYARLDYSKGIQGNLGQVEAQIAALEQRAERITSDSVRKGNDKMIADLRAQAAYLKELRQIKILEDQGDNSDAVSRKFLNRKTSVGDVLAGDGGKAAAKALADQNRELAEQAKLLATLSGVNGDYQEQLTRLQVVRKTQNLSDARYAELVTELINKQPMVKALYADQEKSAKAWADQSAASAKAVADLSKDYDAYVKTLDASATSVEKQLQTLQDEALATEIAAAQNISLAQAIEQVIIARLSEAQAKAYKNGDQEAGDAIKREIEARKKLATAIGGKEVREANKKAADNAAKEWEKTADKINDSITDALMRGFENGKGFAENLRDTVENIFKTMVLRPVVQGVVDTASSGATSVAGSIATQMGFTASAATLGSTIGAMVASAIASYAIGDAIAGGKKVGGVSGGTLGQLFGGLPGGLVAQLFGKGEELTSTGDAIRRYDKGGALTENATNGAWFFTNTQDANKLLDGLESRYQKAAKALGIGTVATQFDYGSNNRGNFTLAGAAGNSRANTGEIAYSSEAMQVAASRAVFAALQGSELPKYLSGLLDSVGDINALSQAQIDDVLNTAQAYKGLHDVMVQMPFEALHNLSYNAAKGLVEFSGGMDNLTQNLNTYYENFYSAEEKKAQTLANITKTLTDAGALTKTTRTAIAGEFDVRVGAQGDTSLEQRYATSIENIDMPKTREEFRALEESMRDLGGEASQKAYAALISVSGAFASVTPSAQDAVAALEKDIAARANWRQKLDLLTGKTTEQQIERANDLAGVTDATTKALIQQVHAQQDLAAAAEKAAAIADAQQSITLSKNTLAGVSSQDNAVVAAKFALQSVIDAIADLGKSVTKDAAYKVTKAQIESVNLSEFAGTEYGAALSELVADYWAAQVQIKEANDAVTEAANQTAVAQTSVADTAMSATAAVATLAEQLGRFGSGLNLRFDLAAGGNKSAAFNTDYLRDIVAHQDQNTANVQSAVAGDPSNTWAQQMLTEAQIAGLTNKAYAAGDAAARLREFFVQMSVEAVNIEQAIADSGTAIGKGVQAVNLSEYFTTFSADLTEAIGVINGAIAGGADAIADSAAILASVTTDSSRSYVQAMLDNLAAGLDAVDAADLATMAEAAGGATKIATAITQSVLNSVSEEVKNNPALSGLAGTDQAYISAIVSGVGQNDIQGINDAFLLLSGALTSGRLDAIEYNAAIDLVTKGFLSGATATTNAAEIALQAASFADRLAIATGAKTQLEISRKNELATALDDGNKATLLAIYAAEDFATANEKAAATAKQLADEMAAAAKQLADTNKQWQDQLDVLLGKQTDRSIALRDATDASTRALMRQVYAQQDLKTAVDTSVTNSDNALSGIQKALDAQMQASTKARDAVKGVFDLLKAEIDNLYGQVASTVSMAAIEGQAYIDTALALFKAGGTVPDQDKLGKAIAAVQGGFGNEATQFEADRNRLLLAGQLGQMQDLVGPQLTTAEQQLATTNSAYETAKAQLDTLRGIDTRVLSVAEAVEAFQVAFTGEQTARQKLLASSAQQATAIGGRSQGDADRDPGNIAATKNWAAGRIDNLVAFAAGGGNLDVPRIASEIAALQQYIVSGTTQNLPSFAVGTDYVPHDMIAQIHKGEQIVPAAFNPARYQNSGNDALVAEIKALREEVKTMRENNDAGLQAVASNTMQTAKIQKRWDGDGIPAERTTT